MVLSKLRLTVRKLSAVIFIFESDFRTQNFSFSPPFMGRGRRWIFFESDFRTQNFSFSLPFLGCGRRWICFESDFRTRKFSFSLSFQACGRRWKVFWVRFSDPKSFFEPTNLLIRATISDVFCAFLALP